MKLVGVRLQVPIARLCLRPRVVLRDRKVDAAAAPNNRKIPAGLTPEKMLWFNLAIL